MEQARFEQLLADFQARCSSDGESKIYDLSAVAGPVGSPIVLLVHGIGGNFRHWSDPVGMNVNDTWLFDTTNHPPHSGNGIIVSPAYQPGAVTSWTQFLSSNGISYINFSQSKPGDLIEYAVNEVVTLLTNLESVVFSEFEQDVAANGGQVPPLIIVAHSRGGLVTRNALKRLGSAGVPHLRKVITLCTPHHGSYMPKFANDYNNTLHNQVSFAALGQHLPGPLAGFLHNTIDKALETVANWVRNTLLHTFGSLAQSPGFDELIPDSPMFQSLIQDEQPLPGVQYYGFGGNNPTVINVFFGVAGQVIHLLATASNQLMALIAHIPGVHDTYGGLTELNGGDSAVGPQSSRWPDAFNAPHQTFGLNHMQVLIDKPLQDAVLQTIRS